jgi:integrase
MLYEKGIAPLFTAFRDTAVTEITRRHLLTLRNEVAEHRGDGAALQFCRACGSFFAWCVKYDVVEQTPAFKLEDGLEKGELRCWTEEEAQIALAGLPPHLKHVVQLGLATGQRRGDLCAMRWSDFDGRTITIKAQEKTGATVVIPLQPELAAEMLEWKKTATTLTILASPSGKPWEKNHLSMMLPEGLQKLGLEAGLNVHGLRYLAATRLAEAGCSPHEIMAITGHRTLKMVEKYTKAVSQRSLAEAAIARLGRVG